MKSCRICKAEGVQYVGQYRGGSDQKPDIYDCNICGCRLTNRDPSIYEMMHASERSPYAFHRRMERSTLKYFLINDQESLKEYLFKIPKFKFVIESIETNKETKKILEVGCSRGYLTSYFIAKGYDILGIDSSDSAILSAQKSFGNHFKVSDPENQACDSGYDVIYHVGTIGCVESPIEMTDHLLSLLRPNGLLLFNAPYVASCKESGMEWILDAGPPDLVTLFGLEFWECYFGEKVHISIRLSNVNHFQNVVKLLTNYIRNKFHDRLLGCLNRNKVLNIFAALLRSITRFLIMMVEKVMGGLNILNLTPRYSPEFMFVTMRKRR